MKFSPPRVFFLLVFFACSFAGFVSPLLADEKTPSPLSPDEALQQADDLIENERLQEALGLLKGIDSQESAIVTKVDIRLGRIYLRLNKPSKALEIFESVNFRTMDDAETHLGMAQAQLALGHLVKARAFANMAMKADPGLIDAPLVVARVDNLSGRVVDAGERYRDLIKRQPDNEKVVTGYAEFLADRSDLAKSIEILQRYVERHPLMAEATDLLGQLYWQMDDNATALRYRKLAQKLFEEKGNSYRAKGIEAWLDINSRGRRFTRPQPGGVPKGTPRNYEIARQQPLPIPEGTAYSQGSGFIVNDGTHVVTNRHVIEGGFTFAVRNGLGEVRKAELLDVAAKDDLAVLRLEKPFPVDYSIPFAGMIDPRPGRIAVVMGYPMGGTLGMSQPALTEGVVSKITGLGENPTIFQLTSKLNKGNSGGPVFDNRGNLIGVAVAKLKTTAIYEKTGYLPEDVNLAIKIGRVLELLGQGSQGDVADDTERLELEDLYQMMLPSVVLVISAIKKDGE